MKSIILDTSDDEELVKIKNNLDLLNDIQLYELYDDIFDRLRKIKKIVDIPRRRVYSKFKCSELEQCYLEDKDIDYASERQREYVKRINKK